MTYQPNQRDPRVERGPGRGGSRGYLIPYIAIAIVAALGLFLYSMSRNDRSTSSVNPPAFERTVPDTTTGQAPAPPIQKGKEKI